MKLLWGLLGVLLVVAVALVGTYLALPSLMERLAPALARDYDVELTELVIQRPDLTTLVIDSLAASTAGLRLVAKGGTLTYRPGDLLDGRLDTVSFASAELEVLADGGRMAATGEAPMLNLAGLFAALPFSSVELADLTLSVPEVGFRGAGSARIADNVATLTLEGQAPAEAAGLTLTMSASADGGVSLALSAEEATTPFLAIDSILAGDRVTLTGRTALAGYPFQLIAAVIGMPAGHGRLDAQFATTLPWPLDAVVFESVDVGGTFAGRWQSPVLGVRAESLAGAARLHGGGVQITFSDGRLEYADETIEADAMIPSGLELGWRGATLSIGSGVQASVVDATEERAFTVQAELGAIAMTLGERQDLSTRAAFEARAFDYGFAGSMVVDVTLADSFVASTGHAMLADIEFPFTLEQELEPGKGRLSSDGSFTVRSPLAAALLTNWEEDFDLHAGDVAYDAQISWDARTPPTGTLAARLDKATVGYGEDRVEGVRGELVFELADEDLTLQPSRVTAERLDVGVLVEDMSAEVALRGDELTVNDAACAVLGGTAHVDDFVYDLAAGDAELRVTIEGVSLADVLALVGDQIQGEGTLSGQLPVRLRNNVPSVAGGRVSALAPGGVIRMAPDFGALTGQPGLDFAVRALTDYRFSSLESTVEYEEDGELTLGVSLQGMNPEVEKGRPIHYNLNITQNVLVLLKSLRAQRAVTERLEKRVLK